jgi:L-malate glycosyltransferase
VSGLIVGRAADTAAVGYPVPEPIHVLYLIDQLYSFGGGAEGVLLRMTQALPRDRYRCSVGTFHLDGECPVEQLPCPVREFRIQRAVSPRTVRAAIDLARYIRRERVAIVHTFFDASDLLGGLVAKLSGCTVISSRRDMGYRRSLVREFGYRMASGCFDQVQTVSSAVRTAMIRADRLDPARVVTIPNGIDAESILLAKRDSDLSRLIGLQSTFPRVVMVGNLRPVKGPDTFLRMAAEIVRHYPSAVFVVVGGLGTDEYAGSILRQIGELGIEANVRLLGHRPRATVWALLKECDVFCLPSRSEGMSNALLEAMASGLPCVATAVGGTPEIIENGRTGYLVANEDYRAMAERILGLIRSPQRAFAMGREAQRAVWENFSNAAMVDNVVSQYDRLLAARSSGRIPAGQPSLALDAQGES